MQKLVLGIVLGTFALAGCGQETAEEDQREMELDRSAMPAASDTVATNDLFVEEPVPDAQLVFVGEEPTGPVDGPGAVFVPLSVFSVERDGIENEFPPADSMIALLEEAGVAGDRFVIIGAPIPAGRAYAGFDYLGYGDGAVILEGGPAAAAGTDTADATASPDRQRGLEPDLREDMIVDAEWVRDRLEDPAVAILDARPPDQFSGETPGEGIDRPGHIPGARSVFWERLVESPESPRLRDEAELRRIFEEAGVEEGDTIVAYCRTGGQGSFLYTVARHLGFDVRLYDGSFVDWSRTDYPVER